MGKQKFIISIEYLMGCQHSRLNTIQNVVKPPSSQPEKDGNKSPPSYTKETKQNIPQKKENANRQKKSSITPLNLQIIAADQPKISLSISKFDSQKIKSCIEKIEAFQKMQQKNRKKMINSSSKAKFSAKYIRQVIQFLQRRDDLYKKTMVQASQKSDSRNCSDCQLKIALEQYLKQNPISYFQVQTWVKEKTNNIRTYREELINSLTNAQQYKSKLSIEQSSYVLNILVEDLCDKQFSFKRNLALNYIYLNVLPQIQEWDSENHKIYQKLTTKLSK